MLPTKCQVHDDRTNRETTSCVCQNLDLTCYFTIKTWILKLRTLFCLLCLINSSYRKYVACMYIIYLIYPIYLIYCLPISYYFQLFRSISFCFFLFHITSANFSTTQGWPWNTYNGWWRLGASWWSRRWWVGAPEGEGWIATLQHTGKISDARPLCENVGTCRRKPENESQHFIRIVYTYIYIYIYMCCIYIL